jgi:hypothetical protein
MGVETIAIEISQVREILDVTIIIAEDIKSQAAA